MFRIKELLIQMKNQKPEIPIIDDNYLSLDPEDGVENRYNMNQSITSFISKVFRVRNSNDQYIIVNNNNKHMIFSTKYLPDRYGAEGMIRKTLINNIDLSQSQDDILSSFQRIHDVNLLRDRIIPFRNHVSNNYILQQDKLTPMQKSELNYLDFQYDNKLDLYYNVNDFTFIKKEQADPKTSQTPPVYEIQTPMYPSYMALPQFWYHRLYLKLYLHLYNAHFAKYLYLGSDKAGYTPDGNSVSVYYDTVHELHRYLDDSIRKENLLSDNTPIHHHHTKTTVILHKNGLGEYSVIYANILALVHFGGCFGGCCGADPQFICATLYDSDLFHQPLVFSDAMQLFANYHPLTWLKLGKVPVSVWGTYFFDFIPYMDQLWSRLNEIQSGFAALDWFKEQTPSIDNDVAQPFLNDDWLVTNPLTPDVNNVNVPTEFHSQYPDLNDRNKHIIQWTKVGAGIGMILIGIGIVGIGLFKGGG